MMFRRRERKSRSSDAEAEQVLAAFLSLLGKLMPPRGAKSPTLRPTSPEVI